MSGTNDFNNQYNNPNVISALKYAYKSAYSLKIVQNYQQQLQYRLNIRNNNNEYITIPADYIQYKTSFNMRPGIQNFVKLLFCNQNTRNVNQVPCSVQLTIDGISGLTWGNIFNIKQLPDSIKDLYVFQITSIKDYIQPGSWTTNIQSLIRRKYE